MTVRLRCVGCSCPVLELEIKLFNEVQPPGLLPNKLFGRPQIRESHMVGSNEKRLTQQASYARDARARVEGAGDLPALTAVRTALEEALGMKFARCD